jgi:hypothetical protein
VGLNFLELINQGFEISVDRWSVKPDIFCYS